MSVKKEKPVKKTVSETKQEFREEIKKTKVQQLKEAAEKEFLEVNEEVKAFVATLQERGYGLDASINVSRHGNEINIFLVRL